MEKLTADIFIPSLTVTPHVQPLLNGDIALDAINMIKPVINFSLLRKILLAENKKTGLPKIDISELKLSQPKISFTQASRQWHAFT